MPRAVAVGPPEPALQISASLRGYQSHFSHAGERIWPETNCYFDLGIETLHALGLDPVPAFACAFSADHDGLQWTSLPGEVNGHHVRVGCDVVAIEDVQDSLAAFGDRRVSGLAGVVDLTPKLADS